MPYKEEDEGYLAAETGRRLSENLHPRGTIRYDHWRRGWYTKSNEAHKEENEGYRAAERPSQTWGVVWVGPKWPVGGMG